MSKDVELKLNIVNMVTKICRRCAYEWVPRVANVKQCPKCRSIKWNIPKV